MSSELVKLINNSVNGEQVKIIYFIKNNIK